MHEADGAIAQIMGLPGVLRDTLLAKKALGDRAIVFALIVSVQCAQDQAQTAGAAAQEGRAAVDAENGRSTCATSDWAAWARSSNDGSIGSSIACDAPAAGSSFIQTRCVAPPNRSTACQPSVFCRNSSGDSLVRSRAIG